MSLIYNPSRCSVLANLISFFFCVLLQSSLECLLCLSVTRLRENRRQPWGPLPINHLNELLLLFFSCQNGSIKPRCFTAFSFVCVFHQGRSSNIHSFFNNLSLVHPYLVLGHSCMWLVNFWKCAMYVNEADIFNETSWEFIATQAFKYSYSSLFAFTSFYVICTSCRSTIPHCYSPLMSSAVSFCHWPSSLISLLRL